MIFDRNEDKEVIALLGAGAMGKAIVRRIGAGKKIFLGDISQKNLDAAAKELRESGFDVETCIVDASDKDSIEAYAKKAAELGPVKHYIHTAGASPSQASPEKIIELDLVGTAYGIDAFGDVIAPGGSGLVISSQTGYMHHDLTKKEEALLASTPSEELIELECLNGSKTPNSGAAYIVSKKANQLRVQNAAATTWADAGARINSLSPGIIITPLAYDEFNRSNNSYQSMIDSSAAKRVGTPEEIAAAAAFLLGEEAGFITGIDLLVDGGVIASINSGKYNLHVQ